MSRRADARFSERCPGRGSNPHAFRQPLLRRPCLPFHHPGGLASRRSHITVTGAQIGRHRPTGRQYGRSGEERGADRRRPAGRAIAPAATRPTRTTPTRRWSTPPRQRTDESTAIRIVSRIGADRPSRGSSPRAPSRPSPSRRRTRTRYRARAGWAPTSRSAPASCCSPPLLTHGLWPDPDTRQLALAGNDQVLNEWFLAYDARVYAGDFTPGHRPAQRARRGEPAAPTPR